MKLLDLFCKAGGTSVGYAMAGFDVEGVDISPQKRYPFLLHVADALSFDLAPYDAIAASPPCQCYSALNRQHKRNHVDLVKRVRELLEASGKPYVIENVEGSPLQNPLLLCGSMFDIPCRRHRLFESNILLLAPRQCDHNKPFNILNGQGSPLKRVYQDSLEIDWMTVREMKQAIPPCYTHWCGLQLAAYLNGR